MRDTDTRLHKACQSPKCSGRLLNMVNKCQPLGQRRRGRHGGCSRYGEEGYFLVSHRLSHNTTPRHHLRMSNETGNGESPHKRQHQRSREIIRHNKQVTVITEGAAAAAPRSASVGRPGTPHGGRQAHRSSVWHRSRAQSCHRRRSTNRWRCRSRCWHVSGGVGSGVAPPRVRAPSARSYGKMAEKAGWSAMAGNEEAVEYATYNVTVRPRGNRWESLCW